MTCVEAATGDASLIDPDDIPYPVRHIWEWFFELCATRDGTGFGGNPISYREIEAWARLTGRAVTPWEVSALRQMDDAARAAATAKGSVPQRLDPTSGTPQVVPAEVSINDVAGVKALLGRFKRQAG